MSSAGPVDIREIKDVAEGLWLLVDPTTCEGLQLMTAADDPLPVYKVNAGNYAVLFKRGGRCWAAVSRRFPVPKKIMEALR